MRDDAEPQFDEEEVEPLHVEHLRPVTGWNSDCRIELRTHWRNIGVAADLWAAAPCELRGYPCREWGRPAGAARLRSGGAGYKPVAQFH